MKNNILRLGVSLGMISLLACSDSGPTAGSALNPLFSSESNAARELRTIATHCMVQQRVVLGNTTGCAVNFHNVGEVADYIGKDWSASDIRREVKWDSTASVARFLKENNVISRNAAAQFMYDVETVWENCNSEVKEMSPSARDKLFARLEPQFANDLDWYEYAEPIMSWCYSWTVLKGSASLPE